jgi:hypothetical protein
VYDRVHEQIMDTGCGTQAKISFDSPEKNVYTSSDEGKAQFLRAVAVIEEDVL